MLNVPPVALPPSPPPPPIDWPRSPIADAPVVVILPALWEMLTVLPSTANGLVSALPPIDTTVPLASPPAPPPPLIDCARMPLALDPAVEIDPLLVTVTV